VPEEPEASRSASHSDPHNSDSPNDPPAGAGLREDIARDDALGETVGEVSTLYLGNILYAIERCALALDGEEKPADAAFYRGIGRKLAEAYGRAKRA
jgi:hypothetical protein